MKDLRTARHGLTLTELIVGLLLVSVMVAAVMALLRTSWLSYQNLVWQSKVNMEARRGLDDICDTLRMGGDSVDFTAPRVSYTQVAAWPSSDAQLLEISRFPWYTYGVIYRAQAMSAYGNQRYLRRNSGGGWNRARLVAQHIKTVEFEYEYRLPATSENDRAWHSIRVRRPGPHAGLGVDNNDAAYLAHTIYVTVTAEVSPYGPDGETYTRTMTSAVHLRAPYNTHIPRAKYVPQ